jgi:hypothetical protein
MASLRPKAWRNFWEIITVDMLLPCACAAQVPPAGGGAARVGADAHAARAEPALGGRRHHGAARLAGAAARRAAAAVQGGAGARGQAGEQLLARRPAMGFRGVSGMRVSGRGGVLGKGGGGQAEALSWLPCNFELGGWPGPALEEEPLGNDNGLGLAVGVREEAVWTWGPGSAVGGVAICGRGLGGAEV